MRAAVIVVGMALLGTAMSAHESAAQRTVSTSIDGFNGLPWGAPLEAIEDRFGSPVQTDVLENGITVLSYREVVLDWPATTLYAVLPDKGLVKGQHTIELEVEFGDCVDQYRRLRDHVKFTFPLIAPVENADYPFDLDFCEAVSQGMGVWATQWIDRSTNSIATVIVEEGTDEVKMIFESQLFLEWLGVSLPSEDTEG